MNKRNAKNKQTKKKESRTTVHRKGCRYKEKTRMVEGTDWPRGMFRPIKSTVCAIYVYILKRDEKSLMAMYSWREAAFYLHVHEYAPGRVTSNLCQRYKPN